MASSSSPQKGHSPQFSADVYCGQTVPYLSYCWAVVQMVAPKWLNRSRLHLGCPRTYVSYGNWTTRGYANSRIANSRTGHLADWSTLRLDNSRTGQLAVSQMPPKERKLSTQSRWWHPRVVQSATCPACELSSPQFDQSTKCPVRESSSPRVGNLRVGISASCPVTHTVTI